MQDRYLNFSNSGKPASQAYWNALRKLQDSWKEVFDDELDTHGTLAMERFENALCSLKQRLQDDTTGGKRLLEVLDVKPGEDVKEVLLTWADMDDLPPNRVKAVLLQEVRKCGRGRFALRAILRSTLDILFDEPQMRRPLVGPNRHWPRLLQYLRELEEDTDWSPDGRGMRLANAGGGGPVARTPRDPSLLDVIIDPDYL